nr:M12 family metallo-peptidase [Burkholderiales bacterium]
MKTKSSSRSLKLGLLARMCFSGLLVLGLSNAQADTSARRDADSVRPPSVRSYPDLNLPDRSSGQTAVDRLKKSKRLKDVADFNQMSEVELENLFKKDKTAHLDKNGRVLFIEKIETPVPADTTISPNTTNIALDQTFFLNSDYAAFDVNVTTQEPTTDKLTRSSSTDGTFGIRVVVTKNFTRGTTAGDCGCGGFAYLSVFSSTSEIYKPAFVFFDMLGSSEKNIAEAVTHEAGHTVGLSHDGTSTTGYYTGHGTGETGWAPIMGVGYYKNLVQWSKGEYANANNLQDDYLVMQKNGRVLFIEKIETPVPADTTISPNTTNIALDQTFFLNS